METEHTLVMSETSRWNLDRPGLAVPTGEPEVGGLGDGALGEDQGALRLARRNSAQADYHCGLRDSYLYLFIILFIVQLQERCMKNFCALFLCIETG